MTKKTLIKTTKTIYPQIYAYTLPTIPDKNGWTKIGYTERQDVDIRIREQTKTAAFDLEYKKLWSAPAKFNESEKWFKDTQFHQYLRDEKKIVQEPKSEWFFYNESPLKSHADFNDFRNTECCQESNKLEYTLRSEQKMAVDKTVEYFKNTPNGEFLWNAKPRFGKTLTTYELALKMDTQKVLVVTNRPAIGNSWYDDFENFIAEKTDFAFVSTSDSLKDKPVMSRDEWKRQLDNDNAKERIITFISLQDLKGSLYFGGVTDKLDWVKDLDWDLLVIDESHEGVDTFKTDVVFENIKRNFTLHLSGTPFKAVAAGKFSENQIYNWSYVDEQEAKETWLDTETNNPYDYLPKLNMFSYQMSQMITDEVNKGADIEGKNIDFAFDLNEFFKTNDSGNFTHEADIRKWLDALTRNGKYPFSTPELRNELKHTFWLLQRVSSAKALEKLLSQHPVFENYKIILAAGDGKSNADDQLVNQKSLNRVKEAISKNDKTITLSVGQLTTGVTVPEWTAVMMLSNLNSPSLYMQAAFRAQNPWSYELDGKVNQKDNAYVFDFSPERTLIVYDEFANNLLSKTTNGGGTVEDREQNLFRLLNFFPVIAEDKDGTMVELDVNQVLTIPKLIKAREVVKRGFMSNFLFQNVNGIFSSPEARDILENLNPVDIGKVTPRHTEEPIDTMGLQIGEDGEVEILEEVIMSTTNARFGEKVYSEVQSVVNELEEEPIGKVSFVISKTFKQHTEEPLKLLAQEHGLSIGEADKVIQQSVNEMSKELEMIQANSEIKQREAKNKYDTIIDTAKNLNDENRIKEAEVAYKTRQDQIRKELTSQLSETVTNKTKELTRQSSEEILKRAENKKKHIIEDDIRARLRGFSRTIPSFLMAYGEDSTRLSNFDVRIKDQVFEEVTGITLNQFRELRDTYNFFDAIVFDESVQEFLRKKTELANYFDDSQEEDIFDYIPPQKTNQIYTPKKLVKMMVDKLEDEDSEIFCNPDRTFADLYMKSGLYIAEIVSRLYKGIEKHIPEKEQRLKHILENQVYGFAPSEIIFNISRNFIFGFDKNIKNIDDSHIVHLDTTFFAKGESDINFEEKCDQLFGGTINEI